MRIAITSCQNNGKTTLVNAIKAFWPMYKSPEKTYRDIINEQNLSINTEGNLDSQKIIRNALIDQAQNYASESHMVHDRCIIDNLAYTFWLEEKNKLGGNDAVIDFITNSILMTRETIKLYDIIFYLPLNPSIKLEEKDQRSTDPQFREEIDAILFSLFETYRQQEGTFFPREDCPAVIELTGDLDEKIATIKEYLNADGDLFETDESVLSELQDLDISEETFLKEVRTGE
jgi:thymidylate kinase